MVDLEKLAEAINNSGMTVTAIADKAGMLRETLYNRLNRKGEFKASEISGISSALKLTNEERDDIFFA